MVGYGAAFKETVRSYYTSPLGFNTRGEMLARWENYVEIDKNVVDAWGIPALKIHCRWSDNEIEMARDARENLLALFHKLGAEQVRVSRDLANPGAAIHDMGTARMGNDPKKSVLNKYNQAHDRQESVRGRWRIICDIGRLRADLNYWSARGAGFRLHHSTDETEGVMKRRTALKVVTAASVPASWRIAQHHLITLAQAPQSYKPQFFSPEQIELLAQLTEMIIPADDHSPGAREAQVSLFIDLIVAHSAPGRPRAVEIRIEAGGNRGAEALWPAVHKVQRGGAGPDSSVDGCR